MKFWALQAHDDKNPGVVDLRVFGEIGGYDCDADEIYYDLEELGDIERINLHLNSPGGDVYAGLTFMSWLQKHPARVVGYVEGMAASAASVIAVGACDELVMRPHADLMIHDAWTWVDGNAEQLGRAVERLEKISGTLAEIYAAKAGGTPEFWRERMREETWYSADEAVAAGLADRVEDARAGAPAVVERVAADARRVVRDRYKYSGRAAAPAPKLLETDMTFISDVAERLGVAATDAKVVLAALDEALAEQATTVVEDEPDTPEDADTPEDDTDAAKADALADMAEEEAADDADTPEDDAEPLTVTVDAAALAQLQADAAYGAKARAAAEAAARAAIVDAAIAENRISPTSRERWLKAIAADEQGTRERLAAIPVNLIPRAELGTSRDAVEDEGDALADLDARAKKMGLFAPRKY
ncbi:hypothetical protein C1Y63_10550 [Corynebacterium sp. 13CS0277]|uniref:head maturation protease, ClpP-related n=1 Tax=Corynebacterium sp. 13CS0277 TaxID=2071994 RepID=UPI000D03ABCF|nr:head maturation protease, ClpP-related [Corynebacterium sp. 13CS0277]PRQ10625.1 hypothetical protein C1Y63_10550 [Corynebacterium sp. 13CS0277]